MRIDRRETRLLWRLLAAGPVLWEGPAPAAALPPAVRQFLQEANTASLERLLIETAKRLDRDAPPDALPDPLALHQLVQEEQFDNEKKSKK